MRKVFGACWLGKHMYSGLVYCDRMQTTNSDKDVAYIKCLHKYTHTEKEHRVSTIFLPWDLHAIILCNIKVSSTEGISQQQEAGFELEGAYGLEGSCSFIHKGPFFNRAPILRTDMSSDATE